MGILEQILADLQALRQQVNAMSQQPQPVYQPQPAPQYQPQPAPVYQPQPAPQYQPQPGPAPVQQQVSGDQLQALIMPHIDNVQIKEALGAAMREAGISALPEAQPHQYADLYGRFQAVLARFGVGGPATAQPVAAVATSII